MNPYQSDPEFAPADDGKDRAEAAPQPIDPASRPGFLRTIWRSTIIGARWGAYLGGAVAVALLAWNLLLAAFSAGSGRGWDFLAEVGPLAVLLMVLQRPIACFLGGTVGGAVLGLEVGIAAALLLRVLPAARAASLAAAARRPIRLSRRGRAEGTGAPDIAPRAQRRIWPWLVGVPLGLVQVAALGTGAYLGKSVDRRLEAAIEAADNDDPNWRIDDLMAHREEVPDEKNSAFVVSDALALLPEGWPLAPPSPGMRSGPTDASEALDRLSEIPDNVRLDDEAAVIIRDELETYDEAVRIARTVADYDRGQHELDLGPALIDTPLPDAQASRTAARLLSADAAIRAHDGDIDGALASCRAIRGVARSNGDEPFAISQIVRIAIDAVASKSARRALGQGEPSDEALAKLQALMLDESSQPLLVHATRGERATLFELTRRIGAGELPISAISEDWQSNSDVLPIATSPWGKLMFDSQLAVGLEWMNEAVAIARKPPAERPPLWKAWNAEIARVKDSRIAMVGAVLPILFAPALSSADTSISRGQAEMQATAILIAAERHRIKTGAWPTSIEGIDREILPEPPADQFTGAPFRIQYRDGKLSVYSIGPNGKDDGGEFDKKSWPKSGPDDIGGSLWDVPLRGRPPEPAGGATPSEH